MAYEAVLFDLDGTLCDPGSSITESAKYALSRLGVTETDDANLHRFVGPPLEHSFHEYYQFDEDATRQAVEFYREKFSEEGIKLYQVYPGIPELLADLSESHKSLAIVTAKIDTFAKAILENSGLIDYFDIIGARKHDEVVKKEVTMAKVLGALPVQQASSVVMVGDRKHDIEATHPFGIDSIGVLYGYGTGEELTESGATHTVKDVAGLRELLLA